TVGLPAVVGDAVPDALHGLEVVLVLLSLAAGQRGRRGERQGSNERRRDEEGGKEAHRGTPSARGPTGSYRAVLCAPSKKGGGRRRASGRVRRIVTKYHPSRVGASRTETAPHARTPLPDRRLPVAGRLCPVVLAGLGVRRGRADGVGPRPRHGAA